MSVFKTFPFAPAPWLPVQDRELLEKVAFTSVTENQGRIFENPDFEASVVLDVHNFFSADLYYRIRMSDKNNTKLVVILPSPENAVFISCAEALNKYGISCRNMHVFFLYEYANEKGEVAPWQSPFSRSGHFMRYFYNRLKPELRMPMEQIHFWTSDNISSYSDLIDAEGGADVAYTALSWGGGIGAIDPETYPAETMDEFLTLGSRYVTPMPEMIAHDSMRGMFGCSGDIASVPPCAVTVGPRDLAKAKERVDVEYLASCSGKPSYQSFALRLALYGPISPKNPGSMMRLFPGTCYISPAVADLSYVPDRSKAFEVLEEIRKKEEA